MLSLGQVCKLSAHYQATLGCDSRHGRATGGLGFGPSGLPLGLMTEEMLSLIAARAAFIDGPPILLNSTPGAGLTVVAGVVITVAIVAVVVIARLVGIDRRWETSGVASRWVLYRIRASGTKEAGFMTEDEGREMVEPVLPRCLPGVFSRILWHLDMSRGRSKLAWV